MFVITKSSCVLNAIRFLLQLCRSSTFNVFQVVFSSTKLADHGFFGLDDIAFSAGNLSFIVLNFVILFIIYNNFK